VWAHEETRKSFGIAGPRVLDSIILSLPITTLAGAHPRESREVAAAVARAVADLAGAV
jgi:hypothetical protein